VGRGGAPSEPLLERDEQLAALQDALTQARRGEGRLVLVRGEAGIGKTALVSRFCAQVHGTRVLTGACDPLTTPRPLGPVLDMVVRVPTAPATLTSDETPRVERFRAFLEVLSSPSWTTVAVIEDAHWADEATLDLLRFVGRRLHDVGSLVLVTYRDDELGPGHPLRTVVGDLATAATTRALDLPPLSPEALAQLAAVTDRAGTIDADALHRLTAGNPFFAGEVLADRGGSVPPTVRDAVLARAARLGPAARAVLDAASVVPTRAETWLVEALVDASDADLDACVAAGMLRPDRPGTVAFRHELARQAVAEALPPARRTSLHAKVAAQLVERQGDHVDASRVAHHAEAAGESGLARTYAIRAAERATRLGAHREAAAQYERALRHAEGLDDAALADLLEAYHREAGTIDQVDAALDAITRAVSLRRRLGDRRALGNALVLQAGLLWNAGRSRDADEVGREAVRVLEELDPGEELANAYAWVASRAMLARDHAATLEWGARTIELAEQTDASWPLVRALNSVGSSQLINGDPAGADNLRRSIALARDVGFDAAVTMGWSNLGSGSGEIRDYATAAEALQEGIAYANERDLDANRYYATAWLARVRFEQGDWSTAEELARSLPLDDPTGTPITRIVALTVLGRLHARRGDADPWHHLDAAWTLAVETGDLQRLWPAAAGRAEAAWLAGDLDAVPGLVDEVVPLAADRAHPWAIGELALWQWRAGTIDTAPEGAAEPFALHIAGRHRDAAAAWEELGCPYEAADALSDSAEVDDLRRALTVLDDLGATAAAGRVRRRLRERGERDIPRGPRPATATHPAGLTPRQAEVLALVSEGLTDTQIAERLHLSPKTVGHHVSAVLAKLGVHSRTEAAHEARRRDLVPEPGEPAAPT
jgi:DNA-binding CsgD family transcriptional regulator